jgi:hypothetical protein
MNAVIEQSLIARIATLSAPQVAEVASFVEFVAQRQTKQAALKRLLAIAPALEAAGAEPITDEEIEAEIQAVRAERRARLAN